MICFVCSGCGARLATITSRYVVQVRGRRKAYRRDLLEAVDYVRRRLGRRCPRCGRRLWEEVEIHVHIK